MFPAPAPADGFAKRVGGRCGRWLAWFSPAASTARRTAFLGSGWGRDGVRPWFVRVRRPRPPVLMAAETTHCQPGPGPSGGSVSPPQMPSETGLPGLSAAGCGDPLPPLPSRCQPSSSCRLKSKMCTRNRMASISPQPLPLQQASPSASTPFTVPLQARKDPSPPGVSTRVAVGALRPAPPSTPDRDPTFPVKETECPPGPGSGGGHSPCCSSGQMTEKGPVHFGNYHLPGMPQLVKTAESA